MGDMEVETEPNVDGQYGEYDKEVDVSVLANPSEFPFGYEIHAKPKFVLSYSQ